MKFEAIPSPKYLIKVNGMSIGEFDRVSEWEGFIKFENMNGCIIVIDESPPGFRIMMNVMPFMFGDDGEGYSVVAITPGLIPDENDGKNSE